MYLYSHCLSLQVTKIFYDLSVFVIFRIICMNKFILPLFIWKACNWQVQNNDQPTESLAQQNINGHLGQKIVCWLDVISLWIKASYGVTIQMKYLQ